MQAVSADLGYFPRARQLGVKILDDWIGADRGDYGHIQDAPDLGAPAPDTAAAVQAPTVTVKWRQSGQGGNLFTIKCSQLGQVCEQSTREHFADPGHGTQQFVTLTPQRSVANHLGEFIVKAGKTLFQSPDVLIDATV